MPPSDHPGSVGQPSPGGPGQDVGWEGPAPALGWATSGPAVPVWELESSAGCELSDCQNEHDLTLPRPLGEPQLTCTSISLAVTGGKQHPSATGPVLRDCCERQALEAV